MPFHRQPLFFLVVGLVAGTLAPADQRFTFLALALAAFISIVAIGRPGSVPLAGLVFAATAAGSGLATGARDAYDRRQLPDALSETAGPVLLEGVVATEPSIVDGELRLEVRATRIQAQGVEHRYTGRIRVFVRGLVADRLTRLEPFFRGDGVRLWAELRRPEPIRTPGGFDQMEWARREDVHAFATCKSERLIEVVSRSREGHTLLERTRDALKHSWRHVSNPLDRAVTASMVLGDEGALDLVTRDEFRAAGLLHLLVVSGSQVAALIIGLRRLLPRGLRLSWPGCAVECLVLLAYCAIAGAENSIVRATLMAMAFAVAVRVDLDRGGMNFLAAAALVLLGLKPLDARDPGAQMSFAATLGLIAFARPASVRLSARGVPGIVADVVAATCVASIAVAPLSLFHFHRVSLVSLPANLLAAPLAVLLLYTSFATALLDAVLPAAAAVGGFLCGVTSQALRSIAHHAALLDPDWRGPAPPLALLVGLIGLVALRGFRRRILPWAGLAASLSLSGMPKGDGRLHFWFLDVGQGDAIVVETPGGQAAVIDAGPAFEKFDAGERVVGEALWALGHRHIEFMALTHRHADHEGGGPFVARHFQPRQIYVIGPSAALKGHETQVARRDDSWTVDQVTFRVLAPDPAWSLKSHDENGRSMILEVRHGATSFLLMGDGSVETEKLIGAVGRYDLVKTGHHGAATSSSNTFVRDTRPRVAVISVGARNRFGHPASLVVKRWLEAGAIVWRTDRQHTLHVTSDGIRIGW
jgi:competence protein ComEC